MIDHNISREMYIGGSDANMLYMNYSTDTFRKWYAYKLTGIRKKLNGLHFDVGSILESEILKSLRIPKTSWNRKVMLTEHIGVNTDSIHENKVIEVKAVKYSQVFKWLQSDISINYRRQIMHSLYVTKLDKALFYAAGLKDEEKENPFNIDFSGKIFKWEYTRSDFDFDEHEIRLNYIVFCLKNKTQPSNEGLEIYKNYSISVKQL